MASHSDLSYFMRSKDIKVENKTLVDLFEEVRKSGAASELYFLENHERVTTTQLWDKIDQYAKGMLSLGLERGDAVMSTAIVSSESAALFVAALSIGVGYMHPYCYKPRESSYVRILSLVKPTLVFAGEAHNGDALNAFVRLIEADSSRFPSIKQIFYDGSINNRSPQYEWLQPLSRLAKLGQTVTNQQLQEARSQVQPSDSAFHLFTSGSTGHHKCVVHTHYSIYNELMCFSPRSIGPCLVTSPCCDELSSYAGIAMAFAGNTCKAVLISDVAKLTRNEYYIEIAEAINKERVEHLAVTGVYLLGLLALAKDGKYTFSSLKTVMLSGQPFSMKMKHEILKYFGSVMWNGYGMSECLFMASSTLEDLETEEGFQLMLSGTMYPKPHCEIKIVDDEGNTIPRGECGELCFKGYSVMKEYKNANPQSLKDMMSQDGFLKTGDMAVMNQDGSVFLRGRKSDQLRFKIIGEVVYPAIIESVMSQHPAIKQIAVVSAGNNDLIGDEITYCIKLNAGCQEPIEDDLTSHLLEKLDEMKKPLRIIYVEEFPRTDNNRKINKRKLVDQLKAMIAEKPDLGYTKWYYRFKQACD